MTYIKLIGTMIFFEHVIPFGQWQYLRISATLNLLIQLNTFNVFTN
jgi:hypothetical protein